MPSLEYVQGTQDIELARSQPPKPGIQIDGRLIAGTTQGEAPPVEETFTVGGVTFTVRFLT